MKALLACARCGKPSVVEAGASCERCSKIISRAADDELKRAVRREAAAQQKHGGGRLWRWR
jgi:hypothetical protein